MKISQAFNTSQIDLMSKNELLFQNFETTKSI